jgi:hypothetical protein
MSEFEINVLPFSILQEQVEISFSTKKKEGYDPIYKYNLPKNFPSEIGESLEKDAWWTIVPQEGDTVISVNLLENKRFAKHYFNKNLFDHFHNQNILTNHNFIRDTEVWLEDTSVHNNDFRKYNKFTLRIDNNYLIEGTSLLVSYDGDSFVLSRNLAATPIEPTQLGKVRYHNRIANFKLLNEEEKADRTSVFPILNRDIERVLNLHPGRNFSENKYKKYYDLIHQFYNDHLKGVVIGERIKIFESGFYKPYEEKIKQTSEDSNLLLFGNNQKNFIPYIGLKEYGPIQGLLSDKPVKFIFIFNEEDKEFANKVYSYLKKGYKSFPGLESFVNIRFEIDTERSIRFTQHNPIAEITSAIQQTQFDPNTTYAALYISQIKKDADDEKEDKVYFKLKELLLHYNITSQVIFKDNINNPSFNYFLPNIAIALLAKLGGKPWRLYRPIKNDLVMGIGADRSMVERNNFIGTAFCFRNDGSFKGFNAFERANTVALADSIRLSIEEYISENLSCERLVIHYYKSMSWEEEKPIRELLEHLDLSLPYIIVTINSTESKDYVLFDSSFDGKMPQSGTFIKTKPNELILCNNTRYSSNTGTRLDGFPLPIKIKFKSFNYEKINDPDVVRELVDQVYQFSRMYWKSVRQRTMPVTIEYSELVAKMIAHFDDKELVPFARNSLWFL